MSEHRVAVISDTHDLLRPEAVAVLKGCECILHAGDFSSREILNELQAIAPVYAVEGNNDYYWAQDLPLKYEFGLYGLRVCMELFCFQLKQVYIVTVQSHQTGFKTLSDFV